MLQTSDYEGAFSQEIRRRVEGAHNLECGKGALMSRFDVYYKSQDERIKLATVHEYTDSIGDPTKDEETTVKTEVTYHVSWQPEDTHLSMARSKLEDIVERSRP